MVEFYVVSYIKKEILFIFTLNINIDFVESILSIWPTRFRF